MTVTRYKKRPAGDPDAITEAVLGVTRHKRGVDVPVPADAAKPAKQALPADKLSPRTVADLTEHHAEVVKAAREPMRINKGVMGRVRSKTRGRRSQSAEMGLHNPFQAYKPPPGVLPAGAEPELALDAGLGTWAQESYTNAWNFANPMGEMFAEGIGFLGYAYLAQLTQRPEYRRISERIATEMTRKWIRLTIAGEADPEDADEGDSADEDADEHEFGEDKAPKKAKQPDRDLDEEEDDDADGAPAGGAVADADAGEDDQDDEPTPEEIAQRKRNDALLKKIKKIEEDMKRLDVRGKFKSVAEYDGWMGRAHLYIDTGDSYDPDELLTDLGNGSDTKSKEKFKKGSLRGIKHIEAMWCYPVNYNANDPLSDDWYNPEIWFAMAKRIHASRLLTFVGRPVPDILKPSYAFGGLSMSQMAKPYVDNWLRTRQAVTSLIESFSVSGVYTNAQSLLQGGGDEVIDRLEMFNDTRSNLGSMVLDKETEEFFNISTPLGTLDALQAQSQEQMSSVSGIPLIVLLGITPTGLNASSEGELRVFYDLINAMQESLFRDKLKRVIDFIQLNLFGEIDPAIGFIFEPLWSLDEKGEAEVRKTKAETHQIYVDMGVIGQEEVRKVEIDDDDSPYNGLDPDDMPEPPADQGMVQGGGAGGGGEGGSGHADNKEVEGAADAAITETSPDVFELDDLFAFDDGQFDESKHKRDQDGKFATTGAGGAEGENQETTEEKPTFKTKKEQAGHMLLKGTTPKEIMQALGWTKLSMPATAASLGMKLEKKDGKYFGTPMTDAEKAAAKAETVGKKTDASAQQILKNAGLESKPEPAKAANTAPKDYPEFLGELAGALHNEDKESAAKLLKLNPNYADQFVKNAKPNMKADLQKMGLLPPDKPMIPPATGPEMEKAKKSTTLSMHMVPGEKPEIAGSPQMEMAVANLKTFNDKYAGKEGLSAEQLSEKVHDFKQLQKSINAGGQEEAKHKAEIQAAAKKKAIEAAQKADAEAAEKQAAEKAKYEAQHKEVREALGIKKGSAELEAFDAFIDHFGGTKAALTKFKAWEAKAKAKGQKHPELGFDKLSGFEMGCIESYTGPGSKWINPAILSDAMSPAQHMFEKVLNSAIEKLPKVSGKTVRRGVTLSPDVKSKLKPGIVWTHRNFASASTAHEGYGGNTKLHIEATGKGGAYINNISQYEGTSEDETLFKSGTKLHILKIEEKGGVTNVYCREI